MTDLKNFLFEIERDFYEIYAETGESIYKNYLSFFNKRPSEFYHISSVSHAISEYDFLSKNQFWPLFCHLKQYRSSIAHDNSRRVSFSRLKAPKDVSVYVPAKFFDISEMKLVSKKLEDPMRGYSVHTYVFKDKNSKELFHCYDYTSQLHSSTFDTDNSKSFYLLCQATPFNSIQRHHRKKPNDYLFRLIEATVEEGGGGEHEDAPTVKPPVNIYA